MYREREWDKLQFPGVEVETKDNMLAFHQKRCLSKLEKYFHETWDDEFQLLFAKTTSDHTNLRLDVTFTVDIITQFIEERFGKDRKGQIKKANSVDVHLLGNMDVTLQFPKPDISTQELQVYSYASYASYKGKSSHLRFMIFLTDQGKECPEIYWTS